MTKGLTIQATHDSHDLDGWTQRRIDDLFFTCVRDGRFDLSDLITHEFSPEECSDAYLLAEQQRNQAMGILYDWGS
jgi:threonine dehydrogenase-like Zn-dependent dehydrogenase